MCYHKQTILEQLNNAQSLSFYFFSTEIYHGLPLCYELIPFFKFVHTHNNTGSQKRSQNTTVLYYPKEHMLFCIAKVIKPFLHIIVLHRFFLFLKFHTFFCLFPLKKKNCRNLAAFKHQLHICFHERAQPGQKIKHREAGDVLPTSH